MTILLASVLDRLEAHEIPKEYDRARLQAFITETKGGQGAELANAQLIFTKLCHALALPSPHLKKAGGDNSYVFEEDVKAGKNHRRIDVYRRGCFIFEAKQGVDPKPSDKNDAISSSAKTKKSTGHTRNAKGAGIRGTTPWVDAMRCVQADTRPEIMPWTSPGEETRSPPS